MVMSVGESSEETSKTESDDRDLSQDDFQPIETTTLRAMLREQSELQVSEEARDEMIVKLNSLNVKIWQNAVAVAKRDDRSTVKARDVEEAYQQLLKPHNMLHQAIAQVDEIKFQLEISLVSPPSLATMKTYDRK